MIASLLDYKLERLLEARFVDDPIGRFSNHADVTGRQEGEHQQFQHQSDRQGTDRNPHTRSVGKSRSAFASSTSCSIEYGPNC